MAIDDYRPSFRLDHPFTSAGEWWLPGSETFHVPGKLTYSPASGLNVELGRSLLPSGYSAPGTYTVHGKLQFIGDATLFQARPTSFLGYGTHVHPQTIAASALLAGSIVNSFDSHISGIGLELDGLNDWMSAGPFQSSNAAAPENDEVVRYRYDVDLVPRTDFDVPSISGRLGFRNCCQESGFGHSITLTHLHSIQLQYSKPQPLTKAIEHAHNLELLFTLLTGGPANINTFKVNVLPPPELGAFDTHLLYVRPQQSRGRRLFSRYDMPATFEHVEEQLANVFSRWFDVCSKFAPVTKLVASSLFQPNWGFVENRFLILAQAIEGFCRISNPTERYIPNAQFQEIRSALVRCLPNDGSRFREAAESKLAGINDLTLHERLLSLFVQNQWLSIVLSDKNRPPNESLTREFASDVRTARNRLTHVEAGRRNPPRVDQGMIYKLRTILCLLLLQESGIDVESRYREVNAEFPAMWWIDWPPTLP